MSGEPAAKKAKTGSSQLDQLKKVTVVVADTGEFEQIAQYKPQDVTTNPSLILKAVLKDEYKHFLDKAVEYAKKHGKDKSEQVGWAIDWLFVALGNECLKLVEGRVSTEVDARLSYDTQGTIDRVLRMKQIYEEFGVDTEKRVLFKIAATWEGILAAKYLESKNIHCNVTLIFSLIQAAKCAEDGVTLVSPFVGRILDYWKGVTGQTYEPKDDPGVLSVSKIYTYFKHFGFKTIVMGASFRSVGEALELAGCDYLTLAPSILQSLQGSTEEIAVKLSEEKAKKTAQAESVEKLDTSEAGFRWALGADPCATAKLAEGIVKFAADIEKLEEFVNSKL